MKDMIYKPVNNGVEVIIPLTSQGKFRCKTKNKIQDYGEGFAPKTTIIKENDYVEWQIGYDVIAGDEAKQTKLVDKEFVGANGKKKNPYELSEIMWQLKQQGCVSLDELIGLRKEIENYTDYLSNKFPIKTHILEDYHINGFDLLASEIKLPTFIKKNEESLIYTEIQIKQQQYATGVQPMLYVCIPMRAFENSDDIIGHTSAVTPAGRIIFNKNNKEAIFSIFRLFGMCSDKHNHDVVEILKLLEQ